MSTTTQLSENSHQGFEGLKAALCLGAMEAKSNTASGMPVCLRRNGIGSRSSSKERDAETGLDYFGARYYSGAQGRFISPDPILSSGRPDNPQSWNKYGYVLNNPLLYTDPHGLYEFAACDNRACEEWQHLFNLGIDQARRAVKSKKLTAKEKADLQEVLDYLGTAGDGNNVRVAFGKIEGAWGELAGKDQIKIDIKGIISESEQKHFGYKFDLITEVGAVGVHEGRHGKNGDNLFRFHLNPTDQDFADYGEIERKAYNSESWIFKGLGASSAHGLWRTNWDTEGLSAVDKETLRSIGVQRSVDNAVQAKKKELNLR